MTIISDHNTKDIIFENAVSRRLGQMPLSNNNEYILVYLWFNIYIYV